MQPLDLTAHPPRSPQVVLGGFLMLARTVDKARALLPGGNPGRYHIVGVSEWLLGKFGLTQAQFVEIIAQAKDDEDIAARVAAVVPEERRERINRFIATFTLKDLSEDNQRMVKDDHPWPFPADMPIAQLLEEDDRRDFPEAVANASHVEIGEP